MSETAERLRKCAKDREGCWFTEIPTADIETVLAELDSLKLQLETCREAFADYIVETREGNDLLLKEVSEYRACKNSAVCGWPMIKKEG